jgi:hypothetical protein
MRRLRNPVTTWRVFLATMSALASRNRWYRSRGASPLPRPRVAGLVIAVCVAVTSAAPARAVPEPWVTRWRADLAYCADSLPRAHPNFFHAVSRDVYRAALDSLSQRVPGLEHHAIVVELARIVALVGDGHTRLTLPFDKAAGFFTGHATTAAPKIPDLVFRHYPVRFGLFADTLWVIRTDTAHRRLLGGRVVSIGGRSVAEAMAAIEPTIQRDNDSQVRDLLPSWLVVPEILHARGVVPDMERAAIVVEGPGGRETGTLTPVQIGAPVAWIDARGTGEPPLRERLPERSHWFTLMPDGRTVYARYRAVMDDSSGSVSRFGDSLFAAFERSGADRLVLDARGNVGGNGSLNRPLVRHLVRTERLWKPGALWALVDRGTFSAAVMFAADLEMRTPAILAGEKTGGHPNSYGDSKRVVLRNTGVTVRVSSLYWQLTSPQDKSDGIVPHVPVAMRFADWRANRDPVLDVALARGGPGDVAGAWTGTIGWTFHRLPAELIVERGGGSGKISIAGAGVDAASLTNIVVGPNRVTADFGGDADRWRLEAMMAGERLVGIVHHAGEEFPIVLQRAPN